MWYREQNTKINDLAKATESSLKSGFLTESDYQTISKKLGFLSGRKLRSGRILQLREGAYEQIQQFLEDQIKESGARIKDIEYIESPQFTPGEVVDEIREI